MVWESIINKFDDKLFYLFYYLILLKFENVFLFYLVYTWFLIKQCITRA